MSSTKLLGYSVLATAVGIPFFVAGFALMFTFYLAPFGLLLMILSGVPLAALQINRVNELQKWRNRDHPMPNDQPKPWNTTGDEDDDYPY